MADGGEIHAVTGVSGFTGKYIARRLLAAGKQVINLTGHPDRPTEFGDTVQSAAFNFDKPAQLKKSLQGATVLYNTYWIRFEHGGMTFDQAVENSKTLFKAAKSAGVERIVHVSIANPSEESTLPYYHGKALVEQALIKSKVPYAIVRPTVIFGDEGILINNIAYFLRRFPVFAIPGAGKYRLQPIYIEDMADLMVRLGQERDNVVVDAVGPEKYAFDDLVRLIGIIVDSRSKVIHLPPYAALTAARMLGKLVDDVVLTPDEVIGLSQDMLVSDQQPTGKKRLSEWLRENGKKVGRKYLSETKKHFG